MQTKVIFYLFVILSLGSCYDEIEGLTIVHFHIENSETGDPLSGVSVNISGSDNFGFFEPSNYECFKTEPSNENGNIDFSFINRGDIYRASVKNGLSGCSGDYEIVLGKEQEISILSASKPLIAVEISNEIDSIRFNINDCDCSEISSSYQFNPIVKDTIIEFLAIPYDSVYISATYYIGADPYYESMRFFLNDDKVIYTLPQ